MPFSRTFRLGMGFPEEGQVIDGFTVESVSVSHVGVSAGRYEYPFEIIVKGEGNINKVKATFKAFFKTRRTVFSGYGNPYQCHHGKNGNQRTGRRKIFYNVPRNLRSGLPER
ncbi:MAG: hypothetical protein QXR42_08745 [Candidatus Bathyarchaeia archaeon]